MIVSSLNLFLLCRVRNESSFVIESFVKWFRKWLNSFVKCSLNDHIFSNRTFWIFLLDWGFYFVLNPCTRKRHSTMIESIIKNVMIIDENDQWMMWLSHSRSQSENAFILFNLITLSLCLRRFYSVVIIISCLSRWSYCAICLWKLFIMWDFMHFWKCFVFNYQSFFINVCFEKSTMSSSFVWASLKCLNCNNSFVTKRYLNILTINSKVSKKIIKFVSRLFVHIFFRRSSNFEHFSSVWCIVCFRASHEHREDSVVFILWR